MANPVFLIDGVLEKLALQQLCPGVKINIINCNGDSVSLRAIASRVASLIRLLGNRHYPIVIIIDREDRTESHQEISDGIRKHLLELGVKEDLRIGVCDRMIENWILADWETFSNTCKVDNIVPTSTEGINGKSFVKRCYPKYQETIDGVKLLVNARPSIMVKNSASFELLHNSLKGMGCPWFTNIPNESTK